MVFIWKDNGQHLSHITTTMICGFISSDSTEAKKQQVWTRRPFDSLEPSDATALFLRRVHKWEVCDGCRRQPLSSPPSFAAVCPPPVRACCWPCDDMSEKPELMLTSSTPWLLRRRSLIWNCMAVNFHASSLDRRSRRQVSVSPRDSHIDLAMQCLGGRWIDRARSRPRGVCWISAMVGQASGSWSWPHPWESSVVFI